MSYQTGELCKYQYCEKEVTQVRSNGRNREFCCPAHRTAQYRLNSFEDARKAAQASWRREGLPNAAIERLQGLYDQHGPTVAQTAFEIVQLARHGLISFK